MKKIKKYNIELNTEESDYIQIFQSEKDNLFFISRIVDRKFNGISLYFYYK
jgi:hypothetical protein